jgi:hypothetical protein
MKPKDLPLYLFERILPWKSFIPQNYYQTTTLPP